MQLHRTCSLVLDTGLESDDDAGKSRTATRHGTGLGQWGGSRTVTFIIGFTGCVGALRENTCLLAALPPFLWRMGCTDLTQLNVSTCPSRPNCSWESSKFHNNNKEGEISQFYQRYAIFLAILLLLEMTTGILGFIFKESIKSQATRGFQAFIIHYREDPDQQNLIDWIQEDWLQMFMAMFEAVRLYSNVQLQCCGIESPKDWDRNNYFNCSSQEVGSREACGVPFSCCKRKPNLGTVEMGEELIKNKQCGYDVRKPGYPGERNIFERGCLRAGEEWVEANLVPVAGVAVGVAVLQQFDPAKIINEKGCVQAGEEWMERNLLIVAGIAVATAFLQIPLEKGHNSHCTQIPLAKGHNSRYTQIPLAKGHNSRYTQIPLAKGHNSRYTQIPLEKGHNSHCTQIPLAKGHNSHYTQIPLAKEHNSHYTILSLDKEGHSSYFTLLSLDKRDIRDLLCAKPASGHFCPEGKVALTTTGPHCGLADSRCLSANERREGWQLRRKAVTAT
uniref:Tetraspanin n=1 Tax=Timema genevievae TaxID=629358 RepID=A0A7R9JZD8_TIMGE|nr:unnamed protein product [Timema genevievae]